MADPTENIVGNTASPGIPCTGTERVTKPGTPKETTLDTPNSAIPGTPYLSSTPRNKIVFISHRYLFFKSSLSESSYSIYMKSSSYRSSNRVTHDISPLKKNIKNIRDVPSVKKIYLASNHPEFQKRIFLTNVLENFLGEIKTQKLS